MSITSNGLAGFSRGRFDEENVCVLGVDIDSERCGTPHPEAIPPSERDIIDRNFTVDDECIHAVGARVRPIRASDAAICG
jgi:hypothetical protein